MQRKADNTNIDEIEGMLALVKGIDTSGAPHYAYVAIPFEKYEAFLAAQQQGNYDLRQFGVILCHGEGAEPPPAIQKEMEEKYGALHDFADKLMSALQDEPESSAS